jgi:hypothetical protein
MTAIKIVNYLSIAIYVIFFPVFWVAKSLRKLIFNVRKAKAIREAESLHAECKKHVYVIQNGTKFFWGTRERIRALNTKKRKKLHGSGFNFNYKIAIIHIAK